MNSGLPSTNPDSGRVSRKKACYVEENVMHTRPEKKNSLCVKGLKKSPINTEVERDLPEVEVRLGFRLCHHTQRDYMR